MQTAPRLKIGQIRSIIDAASYRRASLTGGTPEEFRQQSVGPDLRDQIEQLKALDIPARFASDIAQRDQEIERCELVILRWEAAQAALAPDNRACNAGGKRHVFLGSKKCQLCGRPNLRIIK